MSMATICCHKCGQLGHKATYCLEEEKLTKEEKIKLFGEGKRYNAICNKCKSYGHYANFCPMKG